MSAECGVRSAECRTGVSPVINLPVASGNDSRPELGFDSSVVTAGLTGCAGRNRVAQIFKLPYRRLAVGLPSATTSVRGWDAACRLEIRDTAGCKPPQLQSPHAIVPRARCKQINSDDEGRGRATGRTVSREVSYES